MKIGIMLARGGSKGIKSKNLQKIDGITLVGRSLEIMRASNVFDSIVVSSDDDDILNISRQNRVLAHKRSSINSSDTSTSEDAIIEVFKDLSISTGTAALVQCTTPLIKEFDLINMDQQFPSYTSTTLLSGYLENIHHWCYKNDKIEPILSSSNIRMARQDNSVKIFVENGAAYYFDIKNFLLKKNRFLDQVLPYIMPKCRSIDIDEQFDLDLVRMIIRNKT